MDPSFNPYARGPPAGATFVPFAPQQPPPQGQPAFGIPQAQPQTTAGAVDPFTLEGLRAPAGGFSQSMFQPSFAPSFAPSQNAPPASTPSFASPQASSFAPQQGTHFAAFAPPSQPQQSGAPPAATHQPSNFSPFVMNQSTPQTTQPAVLPAQMVQQAPPSLATSQSRPSVYLTPPEALNKGPATTNAHQALFSPVVPQQQPVVTSQPSFFAAQSAVQRSQSNTVLSPAVNNAFSPPPLTQQGSASTFNVFAPAPAASRSFAPPQQTVVAAAPKQQTAAVNAASFFPANDEFSTPSFQPSFSPAPTPAQVPQTVTPAGLARSTSFVAPPGPARAPSTYLTPPDQATTKPAPFPVVHAQQAPSPMLIMPPTTPQTPTTPVFVSVPDPNQHALILQQQQQLAALQAQMAKQQEMFEAAMKEQQKQQKLLAEAAALKEKQTQEAAQKAQRDQAAIREQQRQQQEAFQKEQLRIQQEAALKQQQHQMIMEATIKEQQRLQQEAALKEQQRIQQEAALKEQQRQAQEAALRQQQMMEAALIQQQALQQHQQQTSMAPSFSPYAMHGPFNNNAMAPSFVPGAPAAQPSFVPTAAVFMPVAGAPAPAPAAPSPQLSTPAVVSLPHSTLSSELLAKPPAPTHGRDRRTHRDPSTYNATSTTNLHANATSSPMEISPQTRPPAPTYAPQPVFAALAATEASPAPALASQPSQQTLSRPAAPSMSPMPTFNAAALAQSSNNIAASSVPVSGDDFAPRAAAAPVSNLSAKPVASLAPSFAPATAAAPSFSPAAPAAGGLVFAADDEFGSSALDLSRPTAAKPTQQTMQAIGSNAAPATVGAPVQHTAPAPVPEPQNAEPKLQPPKAATRKRGETKKDLGARPSNYGEPAHAAAPVAPSVSVPSAVAAAPAAEPPKPAETVPPPVSRANKPQLSSSNLNAPSAMPAPLPDSTSSSSLSSSPPPVSRATKPSNYASPTPAASAPAAGPPPVSRDTKPKKAADYASPTKQDAQLAAHNETIELLAEMFAIWNPKEPIAKNDDLMKRLREQVIPTLRRQIEGGNTAEELFSMNDKANKLVQHYETLARGQPIISQQPSSAAIASPPKASSSSGKDKQKEIEKERERRQKEAEKQEREAKEREEERLRQLAVASIDAEKTRSAFPADDEFGQGAFVPPSGSAAAPAAVSAQSSSPPTSPPSTARATAAALPAPAGGAIAPPHSSSAADRRRNKRNEMTHKAAAAPRPQDDNDAVPYYSRPSIRAEMAKAMGKQAPAPGAVTAALEKESFPTANPATAPTFNTALYKKTDDSDSEDDVAGDHFDPQPRPKVSLGKEQVAAKPAGMEEIRKQLEAQEMAQRRVAEAEAEERRRRQRKAEEEDEIKREMEKARQARKSVRIDESQNSNKPAEVAAVSQPPASAMAKKGDKLAEAKLRLEESKRRLDDARRLADMPAEVVSLLTTPPARPPPVLGLYKAKAVDVGTENALADLADLEGELKAEKEERGKQSPRSEEEEAGGDEKGARHLRRLEQQAEPVKKRSTLILNAPAPMVVPVQPVVAPNVVGFSQPPQTVQLEQHSSGSLRDGPVRRATLTKPPELSLPVGVQAVQLDNTLKFAVDDSNALPGAKPGPPAVPPRDDDEPEIIAEETVEPTEMQRMPPDTSPRGAAKPAAFFEEAKAAFSKTFSPRPEKLKHFKVHPAMELMKGEEAYVEDLRIAVEEYIHPLRKAVQEKKEILKDEQITACFPLLEALFNHHSKLLGDLRFRGKDYWENSKVNKPPFVGDWFLSLRDVPGFFFDMYVSYARGFSDMWNAFITHRKKNSKFSAFLRAKEGKVKAISSIVSAPFQRISQYVSLAEAIRCDYPSYYSTDNYKDFEALALGCIGVREIKLGINDFNHDKEIFQLAVVLTPKPKDFVYPDRRFKRETEVNEWEAGTLKPRTLIFLSDAVLSVKKKNAERYNLKSILSLKTALIDGDPKFDFKEWNFPPVVEKMVARAILINGREKTMLVFFPSLEVKVVWRTLLENTAQKRRSEKPQPIKVSSQSPAARNAQPNYGLLTHVPVDTWFPKETRESGGAQS